jgi:hypothetical protein
LFAVGQLLTNLYAAHRHAVGLDAARRSLAREVDHACASVEAGNAA